MVNNIEQAITDVLAANQPPDYYNVVDAYIRLFGGPFPRNSLAMVEAAYSFERAMDKYPGVGEKISSQAPFAQMIADFRKIHWELTIESTAELYGDHFPCPCCGIPSSVDEIRQDLGLLDDMEVEAPPAKKSKKLKSPRPVNKKKKSKKSKAKAKTLAPDPYGPSTSASSM